MKIKQTIIQISAQYLLLVGVILVVGAIKPTSSETTPTTPQPIVSIQHTPATDKKSTLRTTSIQPKPHTTPPPSTGLSPKYEQLAASVQQEYVYRMLADPNDPSYANDWTLTKVNAPSAWAVTTGNNQTIVAVIDGGFGLSHEDLINQWATNSGEMGMTQLGGRCWTGTSVSKQSNNCDDDNNGYIDDWRGWNFVLNDNNPQTGRVNSAGAGVMHGTEVAGLVGATGNNNTGIVGINWNTKIMPLVALDDNGTGYTSRVTAAIYYAVDNGAQVINLSLGAYADDPALKIAINYAIAHNVVVVAAAGNCGDNTIPDCSGVPIGTVAYPAAYPDVIAVGASMNTDQVASFSSYGPDIDVVAPGYNVPYSATWTAANGTSLYASHLYGTSFASPMVASLASLIKSIRPSTSVADITALIDATATKPPAMAGLVYTPYFGHGVINVGTAIAVATNLNASSTTPALLQAGSYRSEHTAPSATTLSSGCVGSATTPCTIQFTNSTGYKRFLPYMTLSNSGDGGWSWSSDMLESGDWSIRARSGDTVSTTPYYLFKK
ncbi:MAG: serine protease [Patescibacteria group bacterium]|nr:serine protease [Patescibacteria group bacterium]